MNNFMILGICHLLGYFYLQPNQKRDDKNSVQEYIVKRALVYLLPYIGILLFHFHVPMLMFVLAIFFLHTMIDTLCTYLQEEYKKQTVYLFLVNQCIHFLLLYVGIMMMEIQIDLYTPLVPILFSILLLCVPMGQFISLVLDTIFEKKREAVCEEVFKSGRYIGYLERIVILLLCIYGSISTIGFILAAKTLVRYKAINENYDHFQEKYLIGTLLSSVCALLAYGMYLIG